MSDPLRCTHLAIPVSWSVSPCPCCTSRCFGWLAESILHAVICHCHCHCHCPRQHHCHCFWAPHSSAVFLYVLISQPLIFLMSGRCKLRKKLPTALKHQAMKQNQPAPRALWFRSAKNLQTSEYFSGNARRSKAKACVAGLQVQSNQESGLNQTPFSYKLFAYSHSNQGLGLVKSCSCTNLLPSLSNIPKATVLILSQYCHLWQPRLFPSHIIHQWVTVQV